MCEHSVVHLPILEEYNISNEELKRRGEELHKKSVEQRRLKEMEKKFGKDQNSKNK